MNVPVSSRRTSIGRESVGGQRVQVTVHGGQRFHNTRRFSKRFGTFKGYWIALVAFVVDIIYIALYLTEVSFGFRRIWIVISLWIATCLLGATVVYRLVHGYNRLRIFRDKIFLADVVTVIALLIFLAIAPFAYIPYFAHVLVLPTRLRRLFRHRRSIVISSPFRHSLIVLLVTVVTIIVFFTCMFQVAEYKTGAHIYYTVFDSMYFIMVSMATIGYGDIYPQSWLGRLTVIVLIVFMFLLIPTLISSALENWNLQRSGGGAYRPRWFGKSRFVVVVGIFDSINKVMDILGSFFHIDDTDHSMDIVLVSPVSMSMTVQGWINDSIFAQRVTFLVGEFIDDYDMHRASVELADGVFITATSGLDHDGHVHEDELNTLRARMVRNTSSAVPLYIYNHLSDTAHYQQKLATASLCSSHLKGALLGLHLAYRGAATLLLNMLYQTIPLHLQEGVSIDDDDDTVNEPWMELYKDGVGNQLVIIPLPNQFFEVSFKRVCWSLFVGVGITLLGICDDSGNVIFGNVDRAIVAGDQGIIVANKQVDFNDIVLTDELLDVISDQPVVVEETNGSIDSLSENNGIVGELRVIDNANDLHGHVIICCKTSKLVSLIRTWKKHVGAVPMVVLCGEQVNDTDLTDVLGMSGVYLLSGHPRRRQTWKLANILECSQIMITLPDENIDSPSIMLYYLVTDLLTELPPMNRPRITVEISNRDHIRFFHVKNDDNGGDDNGTASILIRSIGSLGDRSRRFFHSIGRRTNDPYLHYPAYASGRVVVTSLVNSILYQTFYTPLLLTVFERLCGLDGSCVRYGLGVTFPTLWKNHMLALLSRGMIGLGIYRETLTGKAHVILCPAMDDMVDGNDKVFVV